MAGISFNLIERGEAYDLEIPAINAVYTHMLGKTSHSILTSLEHMDETAIALKTYQAKGYERILPSHGGPEGQDAVAEKLSYIKKSKGTGSGQRHCQRFYPSDAGSFSEL